jgi:pyruvate kinase
MIAAGLDVARFNFSHGGADVHLARVLPLKELTRTAGKQVAILLDLPGPKLRALIAQPLHLTVDQEIRLTADEETPADVRVTEAEPIRDAQVGERLLMDDGRLQLRVTDKTPTTLSAKVVVGGTLLPNKGINLPDTNLRIPALTERDLAALSSEAARHADWLALSFVRDAGAAREVRAVCTRLGLQLPIMAKIERPEAVDRAASIIEAFDGVMVARGDLGVEIPPEKVPHVQKRVIELARIAGKPVVTATEMLESMRTNSRPTRAEVADVANAIYDGTDAVMLSAETSIGQYPVEAVRIMDQIARETEGHLESARIWDVPIPVQSIDDHISHESCRLARAIGADVIVAPTNNGRTPRLLARHRPRAAIVAVAPSEAIVRRLNIVWGLQCARFARQAQAGEDRMALAIRAAFEQKAVAEGQLAVVVAGHPVEAEAHFPTIRVVRVGPGGESVTP